MVVRNDTYIRDETDPFKTHKEAKDRKDELRLTGWRIKIRKNAFGQFEVFKKHDELLHDTRQKRVRHG